MSTKENSGINTKELFFSYSQGMRGFIYSKICDSGKYAVPFHSLSGGVLGFF